MGKNRQVHSVRRVHSSLLHPLLCRLCCYCPPLLALVCTAIVAIVAVRVGNHSLRAHRSDDPGIRVQDKCLVYHAETVYARSKTTTEQGPRDPITIIVWYRSCTFQPRTGSHYRRCTVYCCTCTALYGLAICAVGVFVQNTIPLNISDQAVLASHAIHV